MLTVGAAFGLALGVSGNPLVAGGLTLAMMALIVIASNAKYAMLGEPLLFSDLALVMGIVRHPGFYMTALSRLQQVGLVTGALGLLGLVAWLFVPHAVPHLAGIGLMLVVIAGLSIVLRIRAWAMLAPVPDVDGDVARHGVIATMMLYWVSWRQTSDPPACDDDGIGAALTAGAPELIVVVQCESFADPVDLTGNSELALPGLTKARATARQWGNLHVSGFGAYTMRTEFGVLFGRSEAALGFRRYDPFLTAHGEASYALPARLRKAGYRRLFLHPHDLRFYGRDRLMPAIGFERLIGENEFLSGTPATGRHVDDRTVGQALCALIDQAREPTFLYAVTMENHGPWTKNPQAGLPGGLNAYLRHASNSDAMLTDLADHLAATGRSALLVFFGDHRPSIPGEVEPGPVRHTPYVMLQFCNGKTISGPRIDLTPDQLHHAILRSVQPGSGTQTPEEAITHESRQKPIDEA
jgi:hypothetical protein